MVAHFATIDRIDSAVLFHFFVVLPAESKSYSTGTAPFTNLNLHLSLLLLKLLRYMRHLQTAHRNTLWVCPSAKRGL